MEELCLATTSKGKLWPSKEEFWRTNNRMNS